MVRIACRNVGSRGGTSRISPTGVAGSILRLPLHEESRNSSHASYNGETFKASQSAEFTNAILRRAQMTLSPWSVLLGCEKIDLPVVALHKLPVWILEGAFAQVRKTGSIANDIGSDVHNGRKSV